MRALFYRPLILNLSSFSPPRPPFLRPLLLLSAAGDDVCDQRSRAYPYSSFSSHSTSSFISSSLSRRNYDEEIRSVKIAVWWDFENCNIPAGVNVHRVANRITSALRSSGIKGPVIITAFGDVAQLSRATQEALTSTGICLTHVPHSGKNSSDRSFMADILYWVSLNPPPAHFFLISGDKDFANILHRLRMSNYNILLASTDTASGVLFNAATIMWPWNGLVRGENVSVRHFNYPPDGLYGSWYGHYKGVLLDDAFADADQPTTSQPEKSMESISESKPRPVPRAVVNGIIQVLHSYPEGINLSELRNELKRNNIAMDKDFFGYKKFSHFLASLKFLKFMPPRTGDQPLVVGTLKKGADRPEVCPRPAKETDTNCLNKDDGSIRNGNSQMVLANIPTEHPSSYKGNDLDSNASASAFSKGDHATANLEGTASVPQPTVSDPSATSQQKDSRLVEEGFIKKLWKTLMRDSVVSPLKKDESILELGSSRHQNSTENYQSMQISDHSMQVELKDEAVDPKNHTTHKKIFETSSLPADKSVANGDSTEPSKEHKSVHEQRVGLFWRMRRLWKSWLYGAKNQDNCSESVDKFIHVTAVAHRSGKALPFSSIQAAHELFLEPRFWDELESFFLTSKGRDLILKSKNRNQLLQTLQKEGPQYLKELNKNHLLQLGDILILEKKWVKEFPSQMFPFRLVIPTKENSVMSQLSRSHGISSIFRGRTTSQSNLQKSPNLEIGRQSSNAIGMSLRESFPPCNFAELKFWCQNNFGSRGHMEPEEFQKLFESVFNKQLCSPSYGYSNIQTLITACFTDTSNTPEKKERAPSRDDILSDCHKLLKELLEKNPTGFNISIFQPEFIQKYGYILDYETLGYQNLTSLLQIMPGVMVESSYIRPSERLLSWPRAANVDVICASKKEGDKGKDDVLEENGQTDDPAWEELGPLSDFNIHGNGSKNDKRDNGVMFSPVSLSDEEYTDSEDVPSLSDRSGHCKQDVDDSSLLLHILDSWDSKKQGDEKEKRNKEGGVIEHHANVNGLVDCSRTAPRKHLKFGTTHLQKYKTKCTSNSYYFVPLDADDKECCAESILGEIKRAGDLRRRAERSP